jgi:hypothetical protein
MSARADFQVLTFNEHLGENQSDINTDFTFRGEFSSTKVFEINHAAVHGRGRQLRQRVHGVSALELGRDAGRAQRRVPM